MSSRTETISGTIQPSTDICLNWTSDQLSPFHLLLQQGFMINTAVGSTIRAVVCDQVGVSDDYLDNRINTIFLDGKPVDDVDSTSVAPGSTVALSASMPGLVGAAMRKGGLISSFRGTISYKADTAVRETGEGTITIKLYNLVVKELGPIFLESGICFKDLDLFDFFDNRSPGFWSNCKKVVVNGEEVDPDDLRNESRWHRGNFVRLKVETTEC
jgi:hypothetical protein